MTSLHSLCASIHLSQNKAKTDIQGTIAILNDKENDIVKRQKNFEDITKHASDFQVFLGMREVKSNVTEHERFIQSLKDDHNFTQINIMVFLTLYYIIFFIIQNGNGSLDISFSFILQFFKF
jgi:hypothetical protein